MSISNMGLKQPRAKRNSLFSFLRAWQATAFRARIAALHRRAKVQRATSLVLDQHRTISQTVSNLKHTQLN
jgi:hypothetical protein